MNQNKSFVGAIASAIKAFCYLLIRMVSVADDAVLIADKTVKSFKKRTYVENGISMSQYAKVARDQAAIRQLKSELSMRELVGEDPAKQAMLTSIQNNLDAIIAAELAELDRQERERAW